MAIEKEIENRKRKKREEKENTDSHGSGFAAAVLLTIKDLADSRIRLVASAGARALAHSDVKHRIIRTDRPITVEDKAIAEREQNGMVDGRDTILRAS